MAVAPLTGKFIQAKGYSKGRAAKVIYLALHTAEGSTTVTALGRYFAGTTAGSSNAGVDSTGAYAEYVTYNNTPWTNPPVNSASDTLEICGFAKWTRAEWLAKPKLLEAVAHWIAWRAAVRGIPIRLISGAEAAAKKPGVLDHKRINDGFHKSDHKDVGPNFPWDRVIPRAQVIAGVSVQPGTADRVLRLGMSGHDVVNVKHGLNLLGNRLDESNNVYDAATVKIVKVFQANRGLEPDGVFGADSWRLLRKAIHG